MTHAFDKHIYTCSPSEATVDSNVCNSSVFGRRQAFTATRGGIHHLPRDGSSSFKLSRTNPLHKQPQSRMDDDKTKATVRGAGRHRATAATRVRLDSA